jgi:hypothetical protein
MARFGSIARAALAPVALGVARARSAPARWVLPALGVALATALLGAAAGGGAVAGEQAARDAVQGLAPAARSVRVSWAGGLPAGTDARARRLLSGLTPAGQTRSVLLQPSVAMTITPHAARKAVQLAAITPLSRWVRLRSGRLPRSCTPSRCEVLAAGGGRAPGAIERSGTRLVTVGRATLTSSVPLGFIPATPRPGQIAESRPTPLLLASDPAVLDGLRGFDTTFRTQGWSAPLDTGGRPSWRLGELRSRLRTARAALSREPDALALDAPEGALVVAQARARQARHRVLLVGAGAAALLAAFVVLAATAMSRDLEAERARLERRGGRRWQLALLALTEASWPAAVGVAAGAVAATAVTALRARAADVPVGGLLTHTLLSAHGVLTALALAAVASALLVLAARPWGPAAGRIADVAALGAVGALAFALARGGDSTNPGDPLPALLPPLVCVVAAIVIARLAVPALRGLEVAGRRGPLAARLAALGLARAPAGPALTIAVVAVGCGLSCFAWAYRATLHNGDRDQAAYAVPLDVTVTAGSDFVAPLTLASQRRWRTLAGGGRVLPVQRTAASVPRGATAVALPLLGVPANGLGAVRGWRDQDASASRTTLARRLRLPGPLATRGPVVRRGDRQLTLRARSSGDGVDVSALLLGDDGSVHALAVGTTGPADQRLHARLPDTLAGRRLVGFDVSPRSGLAATGGHQEAESAVHATIVRGALTVTDIRLGTRRVDVSGWVGRGPLRQPRAVAGGLRAPYVFDVSGRALLTPRQPGDGRTLPVVTDPATAASAGPQRILPLTIAGLRVRAQVVGTVQRFPTVAPSADGVIVADRAALAALLDATSPGLARPAELWIDVAPGAPEQRLLTALRAPPLRSLAVDSRRADERALRADPLARELVGTLVGAAIVALALAALGVLVAVALALRDDAAELFDLEALGVPPRVLRADVRLRAAGLGGLGLLAGIAVGLVLLRLAVDAVQVTAAGARAVPPLVAIAPWGQWALVGLLFAAALATGVALLTRRALVGTTPQRAAGTTP